MALKLERSVMETDLARIVQDIFLTMLSMEVEVRERAIETLAGPVVTASMHLGGSWSGAVLLQCGLGTACGFARAMLGIEKPATATDDVKDVMGEVINMLAGNFKALLGGAYLSLPTVVEGSDYRFRILRGEQTSRVAFETPVGPLWASLVEIRAED